MSTTTIDTLRPRVARGAELLDRARPGWAREIALDRLDMASFDCCVTGQLFGNYFDAPKHLEPHFGKHEAAAYYGFRLPDVTERRCRRAGMTPAESFAPLAAAWRAEIESRLAPESPRGKEVESHVL